MPLIFPSGMEGAWLLVTSCFVGGMPFEAEQCDDKMFAEFMAETYDKDVMPSFKDLFPIDAWMMETLRH